MTSAATEEPLLELAAVMRRLRAECPWKREQTHRSLARYLLEEAYETLEAIDVGSGSGDWRPLREELGDLLLQVYLHAVIAEERGAFTLDDVARGLTAKMHRRNPHVFGPPREGRPPPDAAAVDAVWQAIKEQEKPRRSALDGLPATLPALLYAAKAVERGGLEPLRSEDLGARLLALVEEAVAAGLDPEQALRDAVRRAVPETSATPHGG